MSRRRCVPVFFHLSTSRVTSRLQRQRETGVTCFLFAQNLPVRRRMETPSVGLLFSYQTMNRMIKFFAGLAFLGSLITGGLMPECGGVSLRDNARGSRRSSQGSGRTSDKGHGFAMKLRIVGLGSFG